MFVAVFLADSLDSKMQETHLDNQSNILTYRAESINCKEVIAIRFGYAPIRLDMFSIGSRFMVDLLTDKQEMRINFRSFFGFGKNREYRKYSELLDQLWDPVVVRLLNELIAIIESGDSVNVDRCKITPEGVIYNKQVIRWDDLSYQVNYNRLTINSNSNSKVFTNLYYTETYNVHPLRYFLDWKYGKLKQETKV